MISWVIQTAQQSKLFQRIIVSTDDPEIAEISLRGGAEVPELRPADHSDDFTPVTHVVSQSIEQFDLSDSTVCLLYATSAGVKPEHLVEASEIFAQTDSAQFCMAITEYPHPTQRRVRLKENHLEMVEPENAMIRTQDLPTYYHDAGQFIFGRREAWLDRRSVWAAQTCGYVMPSYSALDIDTEDDWVRAERLLATELLTPPQKSKP